MGLYSEEPEKIKIHLIAKTGGHNQETLDREKYKRDICLKGFRNIFIYIQQLILWYYLNTHSWMNKKESKEKDSRTYKNSVHANNCLVGKGKIIQR